LLVEKGKKTEKIPYLLGISRNQIVMIDAEKEVRPLSISIKSNEVRIKK
jgi:hypothetical protein